MGFIIKKGKKILIIGQHVYIDFGGHDLNNPNARGYAKNGTIENILSDNGDYKYDVYMDNVGCLICGISSKFVYPISD